MTAPATVAPGDLARVRVRALAAGGAGVADLPDGRVVFVHRTAPGDVVDVRVDRLRPRWGSATLEAIAVPSERRAPPPCPMYDRCGGCALQHVPYEDQLAWKGTFVAEAVRRIGGIDVGTVAVAPSPREFGYRNRVTFTLRRLRGGRVVAGFHHLGAARRVVDVDGGACLLPEEPLGRAWSALRSAWGTRAVHLPAGPELRLTLRAVDDGVVLLVQGGDPWAPPPPIRDVAGLVAVWHQPGSRLEPTLVAGAGALETIGPDRFLIGPKAFRQVNDPAASLLVSEVVAAAGRPGRVVDAYCGVGVYGRALARRGWRAVGIEADGEACAAAMAEPVPGFELVEDRVEGTLADHLPADLVILNPPRAGLHETVPRTLLAAAPPRVLYVSCDPATLARDLARLADGYALASLRAFDLFPQTAHVEALAVLHAHSRS